MFNVCKENDKWTKIKSYKQFEKNGMEAVTTITNALKTLDMFNCAFPQHQ